MGVINGAWISDTFRVCVMCDGVVACWDVCERECVFVVMCV
jgi:hypothetical protein